MDQQGNAKGNIPKANKLNNQTLSGFISNGVILTSNMTVGFGTSG